MSQKNDEIQKTEPSGTAPKKILSDTVLGTIFCILSDSLFCISYFFVRVLTTYKVHGDWTMCFKETVTVAFTIPAFLYLWARGKAAPPPLKIIFMILIAAFFCEFVGVRSHIAAFSNIGIVLGNPFIRTFTILGTAAIGAFFLREKVTKLKAVTMVVLIGAVFVLTYSQATAKKAMEESARTPQVVSMESVGTTEGDLLTAAAGAGEIAADEAATATFASEITDDKPDSVITLFGFEFQAMILIGFGFAFITGMGYAIYSVLLRFVLRKAQGESENSKPVPILFVVSTVCGFGAVCGAIFLYKDRGWAGFVDVPSACWFYVIMAGVLNVVCFYLKNLSFRYATATKVATFSVLQIILGAVLGIVFLNEPTNTLVWSGLGLSVLGIVLASRTT